MKVSALLLLFVFAAASQSQETPAPPSHIDELVAGARTRAAQQPPRPEAFSDLAAALARRAREKSNPEYLLEAEEAVNQSLRIAPANFEARKVRVLIRLEQGRFSDALEEAQALNKQIPDDNIMYGLVCDAHLALGDYKEAEASAQRMIDLRQVSSPGLQRGAKIREAIGYIDGALDWWGSSLRLTSATDQEERAYILTQMARLNRGSGKAAVAARYAEESLTLVPSYPRGLTELALDRLAEDRQTEATELLKRRLALSDDLPSRYWLAEALGAGGSAGESSSALTDFEKRALAVADQPGNANALLIEYEAEHGNPALAVKIAKASVSRRRDYETLDAFAWALYWAGNYLEARREEDLALASGVRDASFFFHAGVIARKNNDLPAASGFFKKSLEVNASSAHAIRVVQELAAVSKSSPS